MTDLTTPLARARTLLFVPGNRPERFAKALASGADAVVVDLEDAVPADAKAAARDAVRSAWPLFAAAAVPVVVRINAGGTSAGDDDLAWLATVPRPAGVMLPKAESSAQLAAVAAAAPGTPLLPLIESAAGYLALADVASAAAVLRLVVGHLDFMADTALVCGPEERELDPLRFAVAMHTRAARLAPAVDGVTAAFDDDALLTRDTHRSLAFGFGAKLCIHPKQVAVVHAAMFPGADELGWAQRVVAADAAAGGAAVQVDGRMVDAPVVRRAQQVLARAQRPHGG